MPFLICGAFALCALAVAESPSATRFSTVFVPEPGSPITLTRQMGTTSDALAELDFSNSSGRDVAAVKLAWITIAPEACSESVVAPEPEPAHTYSLNLPSGTTATVKNVGISQSSQSAYALSARAHVVQTQVAVMEVEFADGGTWLSQRDPSTAFSTSELARQSSSCRDGRLASQASGGKGPYIVGCGWRCFDCNLPLFCAASEGSCAMTTCQPGKYCAYQCCYLVCP